MAKRHMLLKRERDDRLRVEIARLRVVIVEHRKCTYCCGWYAAQLSTVVDGYLRSDHDFDRRPPPETSEFHAPSCAKYEAAVGHESRGGTCIGSNS